MLLAVVRIRVGWSGWQLAAAMPPTPATPEWLNLTSIWPGYIQNTRHIT